MALLYKQLYVAAVSNTLQFRLPYITLWLEKSLGLNRMDSFAELYQIAASHFKQ
jgi:hypothetical protein